MLLIGDGGLPEGWLLFTHRYVKGCNSKASTPVLKYVTRKFTGWFLADEMDIARSGQAIAIIQSLLLL